MTAGVVETPSERLSASRRNMTEAARRMVYMDSTQVTSRNNNDGSDDSGSGNPSVVPGESVTISRVDVQDDAPLGESLLPGLVCASESDVLVTGAPRRQRRTSRRKTTAADFICFPVPASAVACANPLASPKHAPYTLAMVHSSEANAGYLMNPPKPRRRRRASDSSAIVPNPSTPTELSSSIPLASAIAFKTTVSPPSLRSITKGSQKRVERYDAAKALLRSDEELEKLSRRIRKEINESELFELALAAERAADAGEEKFAGRASTFGGEQQQNHHKYQPLSMSPSSRGAKHKYNDPRNASTRTFSTLSATTIGSSSSYTGRVDDFMRTGIPTIGTTPNMPDRRTFMEKTRYHSSPGLILSASEPSLLETMVEIASSAPMEPTKRSMGVDSLRDINEVIPHWNELHGHMRTHLFRESVDKRTLVFDPRDIGTEKEQSNNVSTAPLRSDESPSSTPKHRRSRSFFESIADLAVPRFGDSSQRKRRQQARSAGSLDFMSMLSKDDDATDESESSERFERDFSPRHLGQKDGQKQRDFEFEPPTTNTTKEMQQDMEHKVPTFTVRKPTFELADFNNAIEAEKLRPSRSRSACSSETTSVASSGSDTDTHEMTNNFNSFEFPSKTSDGKDDPLVFSAKRNPIHAEAPVANDYEGASVSSTDNEGAFDPPASPVPGSNRPPQTVASNPTPPLTPNDSTVATTRDLGFNTPAHLRVIKGIKKKSHLDDKFIDAPKQPQLHGKPNIGEVATTPSGGDFTAPFEPNSIVENAANLPPEARFPEKTKSSLEEVETRFLALPTISGSASDSNLRHLPTRRIARRKFIRSHWLDSPTTPTDQISRSFLPAAKQHQQDVLYKATSYNHENSISNVEKSQMDERHNGISDTSAHDKLGITHSSSDEKTEIVVHTHSDFVAMVSKPSTDSLSFPVTFGNSRRFGSSLVEYKEEKKDCEDALLTDAPHKSQAQVEATERDSVSLPSNLLIDRGSISLNNRVLVKSMSSPEEVYREENSLLEHSFNTTKSAPSNRGHDHKNSNMHVLKRTDTWDGVVTTDSVGAIGAVNSLISSTSAAVNDAAGFFAETLKRESKDVEQSICESSPKKDHRGSAKTMISRFGVGQSLCHSEDNFKAAVQGVLSHLSLSPRTRSQDSEICELFLPESENNEFLRNYFYCTKQQDENEMATENIDLNNTSMEHSGDENLEFSSATATAFGERIACAADPCSGHDATCSMFGVDTVCTGLSYYWFPTNMNDIDGSTGTNPSTRSARSRVSASHGHNADVIPTQAQHRSRSRSFSIENIENAPGTPHRTGIDFQNQHAVSSDSPLYPYHRHSSAGIVGSRESWLGMFQRVASERFSFVGENSNEMERFSKHSFTPPCLTRRVLTRNQTK